jgi:hypothetical protein
MMRAVNSCGFSISLLVFKNSGALQHVSDPLESGNHFLEPVENVATPTSPGRVLKVSQDHFLGACLLLKLITRSDIQPSCFFFPYIVVTIFIIGWFCCPVELCAIPGASPLIVDDSVLTDEDDTL